MKSAYGVDRGSSVIYIMSNKRGFGFSGFSLASKKSKVEDQAFKFQKGGKSSDDELEDDGPTEQTNTTATVWMK